MSIFIIGHGSGSLTLGSSDELARAGEGVVYSVPGRTDIVAKIWHPVNRTPERAQKLYAMLSAPPDDPTLKTGHRSICWPTAPLLEKGQVVGFLMPRLANGMAELTEIYHPGARKMAFPSISYRHLVAVARNIASVFEALHFKGYVIGDINFKNLMVAPQDCQVSIIDTDSFQVRDTSARVHYCTVGTPGYIAPELKGKDFSKGISRTTNQDAFGLGVLLFQLLMHGSHPTRGILPDGYGAEEQQKIDAGAFPWGVNRPADQKPLPLLAPLFEALDPKLQYLFMECFRDGYHNPMARPSAEQWRYALDSAFKRLTACRANKQHFYFSHRSSCVWCDLERNNIRPPISAAKQNVVGGQLRVGGSAPPIAAITPVLKKNGLSKFVGPALICILLFIAFYPRPKSPEAQGAAPRISNTNKRLNDTPSINSNNPSRAAVPQDVSHFTITIRSNPSGANVYLDRNRVGTTPFTTTLENGVYGIKIEKERYQSKIGQIEDGQQDFYAELSPE